MDNGYPTASAGARSELENVISAQSVSFRLLRIKNTQAEEKLFRLDRPPIKGAIILLLDGEDVYLTVQIISSRHCGRRMGDDGVWDGMRGTVIAVSVVPRYPWVTAAINLELITKVS